MKTAYQHRRSLFPCALRLRNLLAASLMVLLACTSCEKRSCHDDKPDMRAANAAEWIEHTRLAELVPHTARTVVFARDLPTMAEALEFGATELPHQDLEQAQSAVRSVTELAPFAQQTLDALGLDAKAPAVLFYDRGFWAIGAGVEEPARLDKALEEAVASPKLDHHRLDFGSLDLDRLSAAESDGRAVFVARDDDVALFSVRVDPPAYGADDEPTLPSAWLATSGKKRFVEVQEHKELFEKLATVGELVGVVRPAAWFAGRQTRGHAQVLFDRVLGQVGPVGFSASSVALDKEVRIRVLTPGNPGSPVMISDLGHARGDIPPLGGLIEPGVLGVARLSVSPDNLYALIKSSLPAQRRRQLATFWDDLDRELRINFERDVLDNLRGHGVVVAYGLDRRALESSQAHWFLEVLKLESTREAVLIAIEEREPLEQVLNALTTVSKGKLTRQAVGHTLQYAWMDDGELKWALILSDEHIIFVDSDVAFEHAADFERRARPLGPKFDDMGLTRLFEDTQQAGLYLDTASLNDILAETDHAAAARWLAPFHSVVITTKTEANLGITDIELKMAPKRIEAGSEK